MLLKYSPIRMQWGFGEEFQIEGPFSTIDLKHENQGQTLHLRATNGYGDVKDDLLPCYAAKGYPNGWVNMCLQFLKQHEAAILAAFNQGGSFSLCPQPDVPCFKEGHIWRERKDSVYTWSSDFSYLTFKGKPLQEFIL